MSYFSSLLRWLFPVIVGYAVVCFGMYAMQDNLVFPGTQIPAPRVTPDSSWKAVSWTTSDQIVLNGWLRRTQQSPAPLIIYFGGNDEDVSGLTQSPNWPGDWSVLLVNYRGFAGNAGKPSEAALYSDALFLYDSVAARKEFDVKHIVALGRSLGSGVATYLAAERPLAGVILISPYDSVVSIAQHHYPWLPTSMLLRHRFDSLSRAPLIKTPLLALIGERDELIPPSNSERLTLAWGGTKDITKLPLANHDDIASYPEFWHAIRTFLTRLHK